MIPFLDVGQTYLELQDEIDAAVAGVLTGGWFVLGPEVELFESEYAAFVGATHCVGVGNGLDALHLILRALGIGPGDEVIVPSNTFIATWLAVSYAGATPVPVEPNEATYNLDPRSLSEAITEKTRAICAVHLYGQPAAMTAINEVADAHGLHVIEDAAQAHGARHALFEVGNAGVAAAWSFYPGKNLGAFGDGGAITTQDEALANRLRALRNYGSTVKYEYEVQGFNTRLDEIQAAVLRVKLRHLVRWNQRRAVIAQVYREGLMDTPVVLPEVMDGADPSWHLFVIRSLKRDALRAGLHRRGVDSLVHYPAPPNRQSAYAPMFGDRCYPIAERMGNEVLSLPIGPHLSVRDAEAVVSAVRESLVQSG